MRYLSFCSILNYSTTELVGERKRHVTVRSFKKIDAIFFDPVAAFAFKLRVSVQCPLPLQLNDTIVRTYSVSKV